MAESYEYGPNYRLEFLEPERPDDDDVELRVMKGNEQEGRIYMALSLESPQLLYFYSGRGQLEMLDGEIPTADGYALAVYQVLVRVLEHLANKDMKGETHKQEMAVLRETAEKVVRDYAF